MSFEAPVLHSNRESPAIRTLMRNYSILLLATLATLGLWRVWIPILFGYLLTEIDADATILGISPAIIFSAVILGGWTCFVAKLGMSLYSGANARRFRVTAVVIVCLLSVWLIWSLHVALQPAEQLPNSMN